MTALLACIDGSSYGPSVCDHVAWLADATDAQIRVLHVADPGEPISGELARRWLGEVQDRLHDLGRRAEGLLKSGAFGETAEAQGADVIVLGKRGLRSEAERRSLGSNAAHLLLAGSTPMCLVSKFYLPVDRGLVLLDADLAHTRTLDLLAASTSLARLKLDVVVLSSPGEDPTAKIMLARETLKHCTADVFAIESDDPDQAAERYMQDHRIDILILSRQMLFSARGSTLDGLSERSLWAWRIPIFIC